MSLQPRPTPRCARCLQPIVDGEHVIFDNSEPIHLPCFTLSDRLVAVAATFLRVRPDTPVCHACLARALRITFEDARKLMNTLLLTGDNYYFVVGQRCGICHQDVAAIEVSVSEAKKPLAKADDFQPSGRSKRGAEG